MKNQKKSIQQISTKKQILKIKKQTIKIIGGQQSVNDVLTRMVRN